MQFYKYPHPINFRFADRYRNRIAFIDETPFELHTSVCGDDVYHIAGFNPQLWPLDRNAASFSADCREGSDRCATRLEISETAGLRLSASSGKRHLEAPGGEWFGVSGRHWLFRFKRRAGMRFYGLGEKQAPFERSGRSFWFWNSDVWADHPLERVRNGEYDPDYLSIPYLICKHGNTYLGLLVDSAYPVMISLGEDSGLVEFTTGRRQHPGDIVLMAHDGAPSVYLLYGPSLAELTRKFQLLIGRVPLPPLWSLGYHQSRWGYRGAADLASLADRFETHRFPVDGLWLDIDYMQNYRVFAFDRDHLPRPAETAANIKTRGFRIIPILDPGVKREAGNEVYESGKSADIFCRNTAGSLYTGLGWPGYVVFPDFSLPQTRSWWAGYAQAFFALGFEGAWLDMNDPSTGAIDCRDMRFDHGRLPHEAHHNDYALLMARATRNGLLAARPDRRPFLISRSGSTGAQRYCAHWTGDNFSTYRHLRYSIVKSVSLALSGFPFNGHDVGGYGEDCSETLLIDWFKAAFLMPFFRNHTAHGTRPQEPWAYSAKALRIIRRYVRLRYSLLPYLYNLFIEHAESGEAILRPLLYEFQDQPALPLGEIEDQFMVGPAILQAPFVRSKGRRRTVVLPGSRWLRADTGRWVRGRRRLQVNRLPAATPLFLRDGSLIPFQIGERTDNRVDLNRIGLLCCISSEFDREARLRYCADDGLSFEYRRGGRTTVDLSAHRKGAQLNLTLRTLAEGFGKVQVIPFTLNRFQTLRLVTDAETQLLKPIKEQVRLTGAPFFWYRWRALP